MHPTLMRLDDLARHLSTDLRVRAVLGLGSAGAQVDRFDDHSDIDFFVIVDDDATKNHYIVETTGSPGSAAEPSTPSATTATGAKRSSTTASSSSTPSSPRASSNASLSPAPASSGAEHRSRSHQISTALCPATSTPSSSTSMKR